MKQINKMKKTNQLSIAELKDKVPQMSVAEPAIYFNRTKPTIRKYAKQLGLVFKAGKRGQKGIELV